MQQQILGDLQSVQQAFAIVMLREDLTEDELNMNFEFMSAIAQYFTTGEPPEYLNPFIQEEEEEEAVY